MIEFLGPDEVIERLKELVGDRRCFLTDDEDNNKIYRKDIDALENAIKMIKRYKFVGNKQKGKVLIKDIVIPAGTIFIKGPESIDYCGNDVMECIVGLTKDSTGSFICSMDEDGENLKDWFADLRSI